MRWPYVRFATKRALDVLGGFSYVNQVRGLSPLVYFPLNETSGTAAVNYGTAASANGTYTGPTLAQTAAPGGGLAPLWDGVNDQCGYYSANLAAAFNGALGSVAIWVKVYNAGVWTDGNSRVCLDIGASDQNRVLVQRVSASNTLSLSYRANSVTESVSITTSSTSWMHLALTWSAAADQVNAYYNGAQSGATQTGLGVWAGALSNAQCWLGCLSGAYYFKGYLAHAAVWGRVLSAAEILALYNGGL